MYATVAIVRPLVFTSRFLDSTISTARRFNPKMIYKTLREDIHKLREAKSVRDAEIVGNISLIENKTRLKLDAAIAFSEFIGTYICALSIGLGVQYATGSAYKGIAGTIIGDYFPAVLSFQATWLALNFNYYRQSAATFLGRAKTFFHDVLPIHKAALIAAIPAYLVAATTSALFIAGINSLFPDLAHKLPMPFISEIMNGGAAEFIYLTLFVNLSSDYVEKTLVPRYNAYLDRTYGQQI